MQIDTLDVFDAAVYGVPHQSTVDYVRDKFSQGWENLTEVGRNFFEERKVQMEEATSHAAIRRVEALARKFRHSWDTDDVRYLGDVGALQQAKPEMQRWLMADPVVRELRNQQLIDGYGDTYEDWQPDAIGEDHYDYRRATDGVLMEDDEGNLSCTSYWESYANENDDLTFVEQVDIQHSWQAQRAILKARREDTTSRLNDRM